MRSETAPAQPATSTLSQLPTSQNSRQGFSELVKIVDDGGLVRWRDFLIAADYSDCLAVKTHLASLSLLPRRLLTSLRDFRNAQLQNSRVGLVG